ncbi:MATE family efflux transporter [Aurantimicrobium minutum]|uniref:MATE family efflux transporter n=1 Tax=Aurantimicrobium minutum TaxID=708131 RepID=UPI00247680E5|nr:MATE family efflux transporter [Aurantimicrobium minutum]MDH6422973.1 putative MATE family efflux protein [Aurantimicrobium minutum]
MQQSLLPPTSSKDIANIAIPVSLEFVFILVLNFINQVVVGALGAVAVASVGLVNSLNLIPTMTLGALGTSASILVARAYGAKREKELSTAVSSALVVAIGISLIIATPMIVFPHNILQFFGASTDVLKQGPEFMAVLALSLPFAVVSAVFSGILRSAAHPKSPMVATIITTVLNTPLAIILVFGWGVIPSMGIVGAAWATLIVSVIKAIVLAIQTFGLYRIAGWELPGNWGGWKFVLVPLFVLAVPLALTTIFWTSGNFIYNVIAQQISNDALAVLQIFGALEAVFFVASLGLMSAVTALAGRAVGAGDGALAKAWIAKIKRVGIWTGVGFGVLFALSSLAVPDMFPEIGPSVLVPVTFAILLNAAIQFVKVRIALLGAAILPSGDDVKGVVMGDFIAPFFVGVPIVIALAFFTPLGIYGLFIGRTIEEFFKVFFFSWRERRIQWQAVADKHFVPEELPDEPTTGIIQIP